MEEQGNTPTPATGTGPATGDSNSQVQQVRQTVAKQVAELKQQISLIQQQSLKTMQETIDSVFRSQVSDNLQQVAKQEQDSLQQMRTPVAPASQPASAYSEIPGGNQAMASASKSVDQAMQAAAQSIENAEKALSNLGKPEPPVSGS
ncbi:MAG: hypothetical protein ABW019_18365 [Chitinophagaceae bacterium]